MKDQIDALKEGREQRLLREIRQELRRGRAFTAVGFAFFVTVVLMEAFDVLGDVGRLPLLVGLGIALISSARIPQRERLLRKASEKLAMRD